MIKYIFFDVANTLLGKPKLFPIIQETLKQFGYETSLNDIKFKHKLLSEVIHFPDRTNEEFYKKFNSQLLYLLGIVPNQEILNQLFKNCSYLPWEKFEDSDIVSNLDVPVGIISNFNTTLKEKLNTFFGDVFSDVFVSEELKVAKPNVEFYKRALEKIPYKANEVLYIGDSIKLDFEPSMQLGMKTLIIDRDKFYEKSNYIISSLADINNYAN